MLSDDFQEMERQARVLAGLGDNVYVKVPVTNTRGIFAGPVVRHLAEEGVKVNVTALLSIEQVTQVAECLGEVPAYVSVFAGRIADTGRDPVLLIADAVDILRSRPDVELIWASPRELNVVQAAEIGCHVITASNDILRKLSLVGKDLHEYSLETVKMFHDDATAAPIEVLDSGAAGTGRAHGRRLRSSILLPAFAGLDA